MLISMDWSFLFLAGLGGDEVNCPIPGHGRIVITEGHSSYRDGEVPVAFNGHHCACRCVLISSMSNAGARYPIVVELDRIPAQAIRPPRPRPWFWLCFLSIFLHLGCAGVALCVIPCPKLLNCQHWGRPAPAGTASVYRF